nr:MAG TPA: hypothetical protein [Caudoviricetes sp.]
MEKNIPGLDKVYDVYLTCLRARKLTRPEAERSLMIWSALYNSRVARGDTMHPGKGTYGGILEAYAKREALKQYLEEVKADADRTI